MYKLFITILNMSITASFMVLAVMILRMLLRRSPKWISYALWGIVLFRLVCPFSFASELSLLGGFGVPTAENGIISYISDNTTGAAVPYVDPTAVNVDEVISNPPAPEDVYTITGQPELLTMILPHIWLLGVAAMLIYSIFSYIALKRRLSDATLLEGNVFETDAVRSPIVCGLIRPRIYLPVGLPESDCRYVLLHERMHIRRLDYIVKPLAFVALSMHWFNPLIWLSFRLMSRDMEISCDELAIRKLDAEGRAGYSAALVQLATGQSVLAGSPLSFGESGTKERLKNILNYKKPVFWAAAAAVIVVIAAAVCLLANPAYIFDFDGYSISSAKTYDFRPDYDEPYTRELHEADIEELQSRLSMLSGIRHSDKYGGLTPLYFIDVMLDNGTYIKISGYSRTGEMVDIRYKEKVYSVSDTDFKAYVDRICAGKNTTQAADVSETGPAAHSADEQQDTDINESDTIDDNGLSIKENETIRVDSPDGTYRAEAYGTNKNITAAGLYPYEGLRIIRNADEKVIWSGSGYYLVDFLWSSNSKYVAVNGTARIYSECFIVAADTGEIIGLPDMAVISSKLDAASQPASNRPDPYFEAAEWVNDSTIRVNYRWTAQEGEKEVSGKYEYDIVTGKLLTVISKLSDSPGGVYIPIPVPPLR